VEPSTATRVLDYLTNSVMAASSGLEFWAWSMFTVLFVIRCIVEFTRAVHQSDGKVPIDLAVVFHAISSYVVVAIVVSLYFQSAFFLMDWFRQAGMALSGADMATVDIGELFRQREVVSERIYATIDSFKELGIWDQVKLVPEILMLNGLGGFVFIEYMLIALVAIWVYAKFCLGFLTGGVFVGGLIWRESYEYGKRSISYVLGSTQPLFLLAFMQGISARLIEEALPMTGEAVITVPALWDLMMILGFVFFLSLVAASVPREWLGGLVGTSGAPDLSRTLSTSSTAGSSVVSLAKSAQSIHQSIGNRIFGGGGSAGGGGSSRSIASPSSNMSGGNAAVPQLNFNSSAKRT
jgi:hypothetical protein